MDVYVADVAVKAKSSHNFSINIWELLVEIKMNCYNDLSLVFVALATIHWRVTGFLTSVRPMLLSTIIWMTV